MFSKKRPKSKPDKISKFYFVKYWKKLIVPCERVAEEGYIEWSHLQMHRLQSKDHFTRMLHSLGVKRVKCPFQCFKYCSGYLFVVFLMYQRANLAYSLEYTWTIATAV